MKAIGSPRPTCEEHGKVNLFPRNISCYNIFQRYIHSIIVPTGMGSYSINAQFVKDLVIHENVDSYFYLLERFETIASGLFAKPKDKKDQE
jgi:hypothetical protein